jgi:hypothetical protein
VNSDSPLEDHLPKTDDSSLTADASRQEFLEQHTF